MSFRIKFDPRAAKYAFLVEAVRDEIVNAINQEVADHGLTRKAIADQIGVSPSVISRRLSNKGNLTLKSIADFAWALNRDVIFQLVPPEEQTSCNLVPSEHNPNPVFKPVQDRVISHNREAHLPSRHRRGERTDAASEEVFGS